MKLKVAALLLVLAVCACVAKPTQDPTVLGAELDALVEQNHQAGLYDGAVLVARDGQVLLSKGYGFADRFEKIPITPQTKLMIGSISKQFAAMSILMLQQQGKLSVEDGICSYIANCPEIFKPVKIRHLISQSAGIPHSTAYSKPGDQMLSKYATLSFGPGEQFLYQDVTFNLAGKIVETVSGQSYADFLQQNIFDPLGMSNTGVDYTLQPGLAKGYPKAEGDIAVQTLYGLFAEGAVYSTVEDMYRWDQALYSDKLLPQSALKAMFTPQIAIPDNTYYGSIDGSTGWSYGFAWFIAPKELGYVLHGGTLPGYRSEFRRYMNDKATIILLANHEAVMLHDTAEALAATLLGKK